MMRGVALFGTLVALATGGLAFHVLAIGGVNPAYGLSLREARAMVYVLAWWFVACGALFAWAGLLPAKARA